jgi:hypothetical protein
MPKPTQPQANIPDVSTLPTSSSAFSYLQAFVEYGDAIYAQFQQPEAIEATMNAFRAIAWSLSGVPGRKASIWVTSGLPFVISSPNVVPGGYLSTSYESTMQAPVEAQISVYPVEVRGLTTLGVSDVSRSGRFTGQQARSLTSAHGFNNRLSRALPNLPT